MNITVQVDEQVLREAEKATDIHDPAELVRRLLEEKIARRAAQRRLDALAGTMPDLDLPPRQRPGTTPE
jgi:hypothetical protein